MRAHKLSRVDTPLARVLRDRHCCKGGGKSGKGKGGGGGGGSNEEEPAPSGPKLPEGVRKDETDLGDVYSFSVGGNQVELTVNSSLNLRADQDGATIAFKVNGSYDRLNQMSQRDSDAVALKVMRVMRYDASTRPDGYRYDTTAYTTDGFGSRRAQAYERIGGFSRPVGGQAGNDQFGVVRNGKVVSDTERLQSTERRLRRAFGARAFR